ncbi:hypothetical protein GCM10010320_03000 [Streptomyces caelestis]|nr:hypothetical protein GCM10010320_03000 [Streptomyces caelestis]
MAAVGVGDPATESHAADHDRHGRGLLQLVHHFSDFFARSGQLRTVLEQLQTITHAPLEAAFSDTPYG